MTSVTNGAMITTMTHNDAGLLTGESYAGGPLNGLFVTNRYDGLLRRTNAASLNSQLTVLSTASYNYDGASRLTNVTDGVYSAGYDYLADSLLVEAVTFRHGTTNRMTTSKSYDCLNRLLSISSAPSGTGVPPVSFDYAYNAANQRTAVTNADGSRWVYEYDNLGQVTAGKKYWADGTPVAGQQFEYDFDDIGNREQTKAGGDANGANLREASYTANNLNQYTQRTVPGYVDVLGSATNTATVTVNNQATYRRGDYFRKELAVTNTTAPVWLGVTNLAVLNNGTNADFVASVTGNVFVAQSPEGYGHDLDGNMTNDGRWKFTWDGENRLVSMESHVGAPAASKRKLEFAYDHQGRRIQKIARVRGKTAKNGKQEKSTSTWNAQPNPQFDAQQFYRKKFARPLPMDAHTEKCETPALDSPAIPRFPRARNLITLAVS